MQPSTDAATTFSSTHTTDVTLSFASVMTWIGFWPCERRSQSRTVLS